MAIKVGDRVCYARRFLKSISEFTGDMPRARGTVIEVKEIGRGGDVVLAAIDWGKWDMPERVHVANLSRVTEKGILEPQ